MKSSRIKRSLLALLVLASFSLPIISNYNKASAQAISLGHSPAAETLSLQEGESYEGEFVVWNLGESTLTYYLYISGFEQIEGKPGTARPLSQEEDSNNPYSASDWFKLSEDEIELIPQKNYKINYTIKVPRDAALGEYYAKVFLSTDNPADVDPNSESAAFTNLGSGPNFLIKVGDEGELNELATLQDFTSDKSFYQSTPVNFITKISNDGNTHVKPVGEIIITNVFGDEVARVTFNPAKASILRGNQSEYIDTWELEREVITEDGKIAVGPLKASLLATYKTVNPGFSTLQAETSFWIIPWKLLLILLGAIVGVIMFFVVISKRRKGKGKKK